MPASTRRWPRFAPARRRLPARRVRGGRPEVEPAPAGGPGAGGLPRQQAVARRCWSTATAGSTRSARRCDQPGAAAAAQACSPRTSACARSVTATTPSRCCSRPGCSDPRLSTRPAPPCAPARRAVACSWPPRDQWRSRAAAAGGLPAAAGARRRLVRGARRCCSGRCPPSLLAQHGRAGRPGHGGHRGHRHRRGLVRRADRRCPAGASGRSCWCCRSPCPTSSSATPGIRCSRASCGCGRGHGRDDAGPLPAGVPAGGRGPAALGPGPGGERPGPRPGPGGRPSAGWCCRRSGPRCSAGSLLVVLALLAEFGAFEILGLPDLHHRDLHRDAGRHAGRVGLVAAAGRARNRGAAGRGRRHRPRPGQPGQSAGGAAAVPAPARPGPVAHADRPGRAGHPGRGGPGRHPGLLAHALPAHHPARQHHPARARPARPSVTRPPPRP